MFHLAFPLLILLSILPSAGYMPLNDIVEPVVGWASWATWASRALSSLVVAVSGASIAAHQQLIVVGGRTITINI